MSRSSRLARIAVCLFAGAWVAPVMAQDAAGAESDVTMKIGGLVSSFGGDVLTTDSLGPIRPELDDVTSLGVTWSIAAGRRLDFEIRLQFGTSEIRDTENGTIDTDVFVLDAGLIPYWQWGDWMLGIPLGVGWAGTRADQIIASEVPGGNFNSQVEDGSGAQYFFGVRGARRVGTKWEVYLDVRARRFGRLVSIRENSVRTLDVAFGVARSF